MILEGGSLYNAETISDFPTCMYTSLVIFPLVFIYKCQCLKWWYLVPPILGNIQFWEKLNVELSEFDIKHSSVYIIWQTLCLIYNISSFYNVYSNINSTDIVFIISIVKVNPTLSLLWPPSQLLKNEDKKKKKRVIERMIYYSFQIECWKSSLLKNNKHFFFSLIFKGTLAIYKFF